MQNELPSGWKEALLEDCVSHIIDYRGKTPKKSLIGIPVLSAKVIKGGRITHPIEQRIADSYYDEWMRRGLPQPGDVVLTTEGPLGEVAQLDRERYALGQRIVVLRGKPGVLDNTFLKFHLMSPLIQQRLLSRATGTTVAGISQQSLRGVSLLLPPHNEQIRIADVLVAIDDKIELNRRMNETLEAMARAIFQSWFVDFDPVHAKAEGRQPWGMDAVTAALFPSSFETTKLSEVPTGWQMQGLDTIATFLNGLALQKYPADSDKYLPVIKIAELRQGVTASSGRASFNVPDKYVIRDGDVLFSWSGSLVQVVWAGGPGALNQHLFKVASEQYPKWFHYFWVDYHLPDFRAIASAKATTMGHIQREHLSSALVAVPPADVLAKADEIISPMFQRMSQCKIESRTLAELRDSLLPKLMSGEILIREAEKSWEQSHDESNN